MPSAGHFKIFKDNLQIQNGFPGGSKGKESACNAGDLGSIPGLGRSPGEGNGNPLQYSCLENSLNRGAWQAVVYPEAGKEWRQEEKVTTEDEKFGWHHWLSGHESEQALGVDDRQGSLACCSPWVRKELDTTERWNWTELQIQRDSSLKEIIFQCKRQEGKQRHNWIGTINKRGGSFRRTGEGKHLFLCLVSEKSPKATVIFWAKACSVWKAPSLPGRIRQELKQGEEEN